MMIMSEGGLAPLYPINSPLLLVVYLPVVKYHTLVLLRRVILLVVLVNELLDLLVSESALLALDEQLQWHLFLLLRRLFDIFNVELILDVLNPWIVVSLTLGAIRASLVHIARTAAKH